MKTFIPILNRKVISIIKALDANPEETRPVTFWFYSDDESAAYQLAGRLQNWGYKIIFCEYSPGSNDWLCIVEHDITPTAENLDQACLEMKMLATQYGAKFDGWEIEATAEFG